MCIIEPLLAIAMSACCAKCITKYTREETLANRIYRQLDLTYEQDGISIINRLPKQHLIGDAEGNIIIHKF